MKRCKIKRQMETLKAVRKNLRSSLDYVVGSIQSHSTVWGAEWTRDQESKADNFRRAISECNEEYAQLAGELAVPANAKDEAMTGTIKNTTLSHPNGTTTETFVYRLGPFTSRPFASEGAAKAAMTRHIKRGGVSQEWVKRHPKQVYAHAVKQMIAGQK